MRRFFTIALGALAGVLLLLALVFLAVSNHYMAKAALKCRAGADLGKLCVNVDSAAPLPENEGRLVRVEGRAVPVDIPVLEDKLLGVRKQTPYLYREVSRTEQVAESTWSVLGDAVLPSGLHVEQQLQKMPGEWQLGGFRVPCVLSYWEWEESCPTRAVPQADMAPVPELLEGAAWDGELQAWVYGGGKVRISARYRPVPESVEMSVCGMQQGNRIVPYRHVLPRSMAVSNLVMAFTEHSLPREESVLRSNVQEKGGYEEGLFVAYALMEFVLGCTLVAMLLLAVMLRRCLRRRAWPCMLCVGGGMLLLTLLNIWNATWMW